MAYAVEMLNITKEFPGIKANDNITLRLKEGSIHALLGENGAGKTSLMRLIVGVAKGYQGEIEVAGEVDPAQIKAHVSYNTPLLGEFSKGEKGKDIVKFYEQVYPDFSREKFTTISSYLKVKMDSKLSAMSKGEIARLSIALVFSRIVDLYLLDEPFEGIDSMTRKRIVDTIIKWKEADSTVVFSDHYLNDIAPLLDEIVIIKDETIIVHKDADQVREDSGLSVEEYYEQQYFGEDK